MVFAESVTLSPKLSFFTRLCLASRARVLVTAIADLAILTSAVLAVAASVMVSIPRLALARNFSRLPDGDLTLMPLARRAVLCVKLIPRGGSTVIDLIGSALPPALTVKLSVGLAAVMFEKEPRDVVGLPGFGIGIGIGVGVGMGVGVGGGVGASTFTPALVAVTVTRTRG